MFRALALSLLAFGVLAVPAQAAPTGPDQARIVTSCNPCQVGEEVTITVDQFDLTNRFLEKKQLYVSYGADLWVQDGTLVDHALVTGGVLTWTHTFTSVLRSDGDPHVINVCQWANNGTCYTVVIDHNIEVVP